MHLDWREVTLTPDGPPISTSVTAAETATLKRLARGRHVLEIGSAYGYSACAMLLGGARSVTAVDPHHAHASRQVMESNVAAYAPGAVVEYRDERSQEALPALHADWRRFGLIFIDGDHTFAGCSHDLLWALRLLEPRGLLACHDVTEECCCPEVGPAVRQVFPREGDLVDTMLVVKP